MAKGKPNLGDAARQELTPEEEKVALLRGHIVATGGEAIDHHTDRLNDLVDGTGMTLADLERRSVRGAVRAGTMDVVLSGDDLSSGPVDDEEDNIELDLRTLH